MSNVGTIAEELKADLISGYLDDVEEAIENGAPLDGVDEAGNSLLHLACSGDIYDAEKVEVARYLLNQKVPVDPRNDKGQTPLHLAVETGLVSVTALLISKGADIEATDNEGNAVVHYLCDKDVCDLLRKKKANLEVLNAHQETLLHRMLARNLSGDSDLRLLRFIVKRCDLNARNCAGDTPLHVLATNPGVHHKLDWLIEILLRNGADPALPDAHGETAATRALKNGHEDLCKALGG